MPEPSAHAKYHRAATSWVEATQTRVPARVRPWVQMFKGDDRVTIVAATQRQSAGARGSRLA